MNLPVLLRVVAAFCFLVAVGCALAGVHSNGQAWEAGGLLALALSFLP